MMLYLGVYPQGARNSPHGSSPDLPDSTHEVGWGLTTMTSRAGPTKAQMAPLPSDSQQLWREKSYLGNFVHPPQRHLHPSGPQPQ